ncbi:MAG: short-chain fatty acyl-CoA regulator family protein [Rhodospirillales bacterium]
MFSSILGTRIRQRRKEVGITQADLARKVGISPSYLNLIEWNKRRIAGQLLRNIADTLGLSVDDLGGVAERRLQSTLTEIAHLPALATADIEADRTSELIGRFPGWAKGVAALAHSEREATAKAQILSDRMSNDPFLGEAIHRMLTRVAAIRSAAEILVEYPDASADRRDRFLGIINEEARVLSDVGEALAAYLDKAEDTQRVMTPLDEVEALFDSNDNHFSEIEHAAGPLNETLTDPHPVSRRDLSRQLTDKHLRPIIEEIVADHPQIETATARERARRLLADYAVGAILMPMAPFVERARELAYDIEALSEAFSVDVTTVCHRLTAIPRQNGVPRLTYLQANAAGTIIEVVGRDELAIPRYAAACPLWALYRAQQSPESIIRQRALFPSGDRFVFVARARHVGPSGFGRPRHYLTDMLAMSEADAAFTVYAPDPSAIVEEVGPSCRLCDRRSCDHRVEDPFLE